MYVFLTLPVLIGLINKANITLDWRGEFEVPNSVSYTALIAEVPIAAELDSPSQYIKHDAHLKNITQ